jgi:hypothetical protein
MTTKLPPLPVGIAPGSGYWNDWYEKLRTLVNSITSGVSWTLITGTPTSLSGYGIIDPVELTTNKNNANGYAGLNASNRTTKGVDTTDDVITDSTAKGLVMKSSNGHYWRATISNLGVVSWADLGTTKP